MCLRIFEKNFLTSDIIANVIESSEQSSHPVENATNNERRGLVWRSNGYWDIPSTGNTIQFRESTGVDLVVTVPSGTYNSSTSLTQAITTAMNALAGTASTYTVSVDATTKKIKFVSDLVGGDNIFEIDWTVSTVMGDILGFVLDDTTGGTHLADVLKIAHPNEFITFDMGIETNPRNFFLTGPRNEPLKLSPSATFKLKGNETNPTDWSAPTYEATLTYDDENFLLMSLSGLNPTGGLRYWRLELNDTGDTGAPMNGNPAGHVEVGALFLGDELWTDLTNEENRGRVRFGFQSRYVDNSESENSDGGEKFSDVKTQTQEYSFQWNALTKHQVEEIETFFRKVGTHTSFPIVFDPDSPINTEGPNNWTDVHRGTKFVTFVSEPQWTIDFSNYFTLSMQVVEEL